MFQIVHNNHRRQNAKASQAKPFVAAVPYIDVSTKV